METIRVTTIEDDGMLVIKGLPFVAGDTVEVIIRNHRQADAPREAYPLRGTLIHYDEPFESAAPSDWEVLP